MIEPQFVLEFAVILLNAPAVSAPMGKLNTRFRVQADFPTVFHKAGTLDGVAYGSYRSTGVRVNAGIAIPFGK